MTTELDHIRTGILEDELADSLAVIQCIVLSNTMDVTFCAEALEEALARHGRPEIFNTDQGSQFTSLAFTQMLTDANVRISMDGRGRWMDNVFIERL